MSPQLAWLVPAALLLSAATAAADPRPPVEAPRPVLLTIADAPWAGPIIVMPAAAAPAVDPAKDAASRVEPGAAIERAFRLMERGWGNDALADELAPYFDAATARRFAAAAGSFDRSPETFRPTGLSPLRVTRLGGAVARYDYLQTFPRAVMLWSFTFTRHDGRWLFRNVTWNRRPESRPDLFDAAGPVEADLAEPDAAVRKFAETLGADAETALTSMMTPAASGDTGLRPEDRAFVDLALDLRSKVAWKHRGIELVSAVPLTPSLVRYALVEHSDDETFVWQIFFYRTADGWAVIDAHFNSGLSGLSRLLPGLPAPAADPSPSRGPDRPAADDLLRLGNDPFRRN